VQAGLLHDPALEVLEEETPAEAEEAAAVAALDAAAEPADAESTDAPAAEPAAAAEGEAPDAPAAAEADGESPVPAEDEARPADAS
jgi:hypothetical protein